MLVSNGPGRSTFVFIHIQKTGGASISELLKAAAPDATFHSPRHMFAREAIERVEHWDEHFKFAFVRNPWDRLVSWYSMIDKARARAYSDPARERQRERLTKNPLYRQVLRNAPTFEDFIKNCTDEVHVRDGSYYSFAYNQLDYLTDENGSLLVDYVGRFERFAGDLVTAFSKTGLDLNALHTPIPHRNRSAHGDYRGFYTAETERMVRERFARDIEYFGYDFEDTKSHTDLYTSI